MTTIASDDIELLDSYRRGRDAEAFAELVRRYAGLVFATAQRVTGNRCDAQDVTQACFMELARQSQRVQTSVGGWLHAVATNRARSTVRDQVARRTRERDVAAQRRVEIEDHEPAWSEVEPLVDEAIERLPAELREPLVEHYLRGVSQADLAERLGVNQSTVSRRIERAVDELRAALQAAGVGVSAAAVVSGLASAPVLVPEPLVGSLVKMALAGVRARGPAGAIASLGGSKLLAGVGAVLLIGAAALAIVVASGRGSGNHAMSAASQPAPSTQASTAPAPRIVREGDRVFVTGLEGAEWGNQTERQETALAAVTEILRAIGQDVSYEQVMGFGGSAFRIQKTKGLLSPESPNAVVGRDCIHPALAAFGYAADPIDLDGGNPQPEDLLKARLAVMESINRGVPLLGGREEWDVVVGYARGGDEWLVRPYSPRGKGYQVAGQMPWGVWTIRPRAEGAPSRRDATIRALQAAVEMAYTPAYGDQESGFAAYRNWAEHLRGDVQMSEALGNGYMYGCLWNQRDMASRFLRGQASQFGAEGGAHLMKAADLYRRIYDVMREQRPDLRHPWQYMPWSLNGRWTRPMRIAQAAMLDEIAEIERQAIGEIELALRAEGFPATRPSTAGSATKDAGGTTAP